MEGELLNSRIEKPNYIAKSDHAHKIKLRKLRTDVAKFSFLNRGVREWNMLREEVFKPYQKQ